VLDSSSDKQPSDRKPVQSDDSEGIHNTLVYITHTRHHMWAPTIDCK